MSRSMEKDLKKLKKQLDYLESSLTNAGESDIPVIKASATRTVNGFISFRHELYNDTTDKAPGTLNCATGQDFIGLYESLDEIACVLEPMSNQLDSLKNQVQGQVTKEGLENVTKKLTEIWEKFELLLKKLQDYHKAQKAAQPKKINYKLIAIIVIVVVLIIILIVYFMRKGETFIFDEPDF